MSDKTIGWTPELREALRKRHAQAVEYGEDHFEFMGDLYNTKYAKYLLALLDTRLPPPGVTVVDLDDVETMHNTIGEATR